MRPGLRFIPVWRRNFLVWRKLALPSMLGNLADPMIYMLGLGYGLGAFLPEIAGVPYIAFLAAGTVCFSTANSATFESLYSAFSRMHVQKTWDAILNAPLTLEDVVLGELVWAASKSFLSGLAIMLVVWVLGLSTSPLSLVALVVIPVIGLAFAALGLAVTAVSPSYDFFMYYFTLFITPMAMLCGVFYPMDALPEVVRWFSQVLPLAHATQLIRPLLFGEWPAHALWHVLALLAYAAAGFWIALRLFRRRLLK
ncbi:MAG: ABC transporter permease [Pseudomonadota bacterium]|jgi:ABC-2 type transporter, NodJ family